MLMGDLNSTPAGSAYRQLAATEVSELRDARLSSRTRPYGPPGTFNAFKIDSDAEAPIDHIFVSTEFAVEKYAVVTQHWGGRLPSDHYPVMVDLIFHGR
jgi:endonuclease/exonuclease/phosphatase family metal-dependent hydrolase